MESIYATVFSIVINQINAKKGQMFFPLISALFIYILINNLVGMVPYSFAPTSHFILTFSISFTVVIGATILGFQIHSLKFFSLLEIGIAFIQAQVFVVLSASYIKDCLELH